MLFPLGRAFRSSLRELLSALRSRSPVFFGCLCAGAAIPIFFTLYTRLAWEDFFITYRYSENLARGHGLVYSVGERVYGFTSPLNTLLPALFAAVLSAKDYVGPLWLYRGVSLAGLLAAAVSIVSVFTRAEGASRVRVLIGAVFPVLAACEIKSTAFAMSGQEAGLVLGLLAPVFALAVLGWPQHRVFGGVLCAGLMYSRPDAFVYLIAIASAAVVFSLGPKKALLAAFSQSAVIGALLYLPWLLFTWSYYGSPIPHTVIAKHNLVAYAHAGYGLMAMLVAGIGAAPAVLSRALSPIYDMLNAGPGSWPSWIHDGELALGLISVFYWLVPSRDRLGRMASLVSFVLLSYLIYTDLASQYCPWYYPPLAFMCLVTLASAAATLAEQVRMAALRNGIAALALGVLLFFLGFIFFSSLMPLRFKQQVIDGGQRRQIGLWLKDHVSPDETVFLEPLGYIGYFSQRKMADWPGLVSPAVVEARKTIGVTAGYFTWAEVAAALKPAWIVARASEGALLAQNDFLSHHYELLAVFDARPSIEKLGKEASAPGMNIAYPEAVFGVYHRTN